jgi:hypothetical protein
MATPLICFTCDRPLHRARYLWWGWVPLCLDCGYRIAYAEALTAAGTPEWRLLPEN